MRLLKQKFSILTNINLLLVEGKEDEMLGSLQIKPGKTIEWIHNLISELKNPVSRKKN